MPSFDIVSEVDEAEVLNALNQARKELATRFDFKDAHAEIEFEKSIIKLRANDAFKIKALEDIVLGKLARRNVSLKNIDRKPSEVSSMGRATLELHLKQGLETDVAKLITQSIKDQKLKVQAQIQDRQVRVTGKSRDDLQTVMAHIRATEFPVTLNFKNFRD
jgi:cyclic-di-GMP-binding protein